MTRIISYSILFIFLIYFSSCNKNEEIMPEEESCIDTEFINQTTVCYEIYAPVCGCNEKTYSNDCIAESNGILRYVDGTCKE
jgi:hypothetical protein